MKFRFIHFLLFFHCWLYRHSVMCQDEGTITMVSVRVNSLDEMAGTGNFVHLCGGSLITTSVVFTGCSCITKKAPVEKDTEDKDKVELLAADQVQVYAGVSADTANKDATSQNAMALALSMHTLCDATFVYNYGMIKLANAFRLENGLELSHVLSLDMSDFEKKMMNMKPGDCWTETWVMKEGGDDLVDKKTTKPPPDYTEITGKTEGTITEFVETKVAVVTSGSGSSHETDETTLDGSGTSDDERTTEEETTETEAEIETSDHDYSSSDGESTTPSESVESSEETEEPSSEEPEESSSDSVTPDEINTATQKDGGASGKNTTISPMTAKLRAANVTTHPNITSIRPSNVTQQNGTSNVAVLVPGNGTNIAKTNATGNTTSIDGGGATNKSADGEAPNAGQGSNATDTGAVNRAKSGGLIKPARIRRNLVLEINEKEKLGLKGTVIPKYGKPPNSAKSKILRRRPKRAGPAPKVGAPASANITMGLANGSHPGAPPTGANATAGAEANASSVAGVNPPVALNETRVGPTSNASAIPSNVIPGSNVTGGGNSTEVLLSKSNVANASVVGNKTAPGDGSVLTNVIPTQPGLVVPETTEDSSDGCGSESEGYEDYTSESGSSTPTDEAEETDTEEPSTTEGSTSEETETETIEEEEPDGSTSSVVKTTTPDDDTEREYTDETPEPVEHPTGTLPSESTPGSEPPASIDKEKPQRVSHLNVNFLDWKECTKLVCPDPSVTCDSEQMDTKWCLSSEKPDVRLCAADTGAPVYCMSSMVAILSNVNLECPKTTTKGVGVGLDGAFEYIKSTMGMPDFQKKVPPVAPVRARKASAPKNYVPTVVLTLMMFLQALLHL